MERIVQQKTFQKKLENAVKDKKGRPLGEDLEELTNIVFEKLKEGENPEFLERHLATITLKKKLFQDISKSVSNM